MTVAQRSPAREAGFTMIELVIAASLLTLLIHALTSLALTGSQGQEYARRLNRSTEITHDLLDQMRTEMTSCVRVFHADTEGAENLALWDLAGAPVPLPNRRLPTAAVAEQPRPDTVGAEITGNSLFFAQLAWSDRFRCTSGNQYYVDVHRWIYYYLTEEDGGPMAGRPIGLNLARVISEPLVDGASVDRITDPDDQAEMLLHLHDGTPDLFGTRHPACEVVWTRGALPSVSGTLRMIDNSDGSLSATPIGARTSPWTILRTSTTRPGLLTYRHHSVATNFSPDNWGLCRYGLLNATGSGFPHGFEVQVTGPATARQTMLHLVVCSTNRSGHWAWSDVQVSMDTRDL